MTSAAMTSMGFFLAFMDVRQRGVPRLVQAEVG